MSFLPIAPRICWKRALVLGATTCLLSGGKYAAAAGFALPANATVIKSGWDRIDIDVRFEIEEDLRGRPQRECYLAFPAREYDWRPTYIECTVFDNKGRLIKEGYMPTGKEIDETHLRSVLSVTSGLCHDRVVSRLEFRPVLTPLTDARAGQIFHLRRLRVAVEFKGPLFAEYESISERIPDDPLGFKKLFQSLLINYDSSLAFRVRERNPEERGQAFHAVLAKAASGKGACKFAVRGKGMHRIDAGTLSEAGIDLAAIPRDSMRLWRDGREVPYLLWPEPDSPGLSAGASLYFYDDGEGTDYSKENIYWLTLGVGQVESSPQVVCDCPGPASPCEAFQEVQTLGTLNHMPRDRQQFSAIWFRDVIIGNRLHVYPFVLPAATGETVDFHIGLRNGFREELVVAAYVNGASAGSLRVEPLGGQDGPIGLDFSLPLERIHESTNELSVRIVNEHERPPEGLYYGLYVEELEVTHWRRLHGTDGRLRVDLPQSATGCFRLQPTGLGGGRTLGFQVAPRFQVLAGLPERVNEGFALPVEGGGVFEFLHPAAASTVEGVTRFSGCTLRQEGNQANFIVVGPREFEADIAPLLEFREKQGYTPLFVDVQAVYDEFSFGVPDPHAIRDFIRYALGKWDHPLPSSVLLVGDAYWDYRNQTESPFRNYVPTYIPAARLDEAGSDVWFARALKDPSLEAVDAPDVFLARIPAQTRDEVKSAVAKFIAYETDSELGPWRSRVFFATDHNFERNAASIAKESVPRWAAPDHFAYADFPLEDHFRIQILRPERKAHTKTSPTATAELVMNINQGALLWDYVGHGGAFVLSNSDLFIGNDRYDTDVLRLHNQRRLPFFCSLSCLTGLFYINRPWSYCLGESLLFSQSGAIATYTPCSVGSSSAQEQLSKRIKTAVFSIPDPRLGEAICSAQLTGLLSEGVKQLVPQFMLFGDPATRLAVPEENLQVRVAAQEDGSEGRRLKLVFASEDITSGTAKLTLYDMEHWKVLWESQPMEFSTSAKGMELSLAELEPDEEGILQIYAWNPVLGLEAAGWTVVAALQPKVLIIDDLSLLQSDLNGLNGTVAIKNQTSRKEEGILFSGFMDDRLIFQDQIGPLGPKERLFCPVELNAERGIHQAVFVVRSESEEMDRFVFPFAVPDPAREATPVIVADTLSVRPASPALAEIVDPEGPLPPGVKAELSACVVNPSTAESVACELNFECETAQAVASTDVPTLRPGETATVTASWTLPRPGEHILAAWLSSAADAATPYQKVVTKDLVVGGYPDLAFANDGVSCEPANPTEGESVRFHIRYRNQGKMAAGEFYPGIYELQADGSQVPIRNMAQAVSPLQWPSIQQALEPGESAELSILWHPSDNIGMRRFVAVLDDMNHIPESDEENNRYELEMEFPPGLNTLRERRADAWSRMDFDAAKEVNRKIETFLDAQLARFDGDRTWLDYDWFAQRGFSALVSGNLERAIEVLGWGIELLPTYAANYNLMACAELRRGQLATAKQILLRADEEGTFDHYWRRWLGSEDPLCQAALRSLENGEPAPAEKLLEECITQTPVNSDAWWLLYQVRSELGDIRGALTALRRYVDARSPSEAHGLEWYEAMYETLANKLNRPSAAREVVEEAIAAYPSDTRFHFLIPYLEYLEGIPSGEIRDRIRESTLKMRTLRGLTAALYLLLVRLDLDLDDAESLTTDYNTFVFHSSKTSPRSGFCSWPRVTFSKKETNPELRVFLEPDVNPSQENMLAFLLEKSEVAEPAEVPAPATLELPLTITIDLGSPKAVDACLIAVNPLAAGQLWVTLSASADNGSGAKEVESGVVPSGGKHLVLRFTTMRSRFWHVHFTSPSEEQVLLLRDLSLMEKRVESAHPTKG